MAPYQHQKVRRKKRASGSGTAAGETALNPNNLVAGGSARAGRARAGRSKKEEALGGVRLWSPPSFFRSWSTVPCLSCWYSCSTILHERPKSYTSGTCGWHDSCWYSCSTRSHEIPEHVWHFCSTSLRSLENVGYYQNDNMPCLSCWYSCSTTLGQSQTHVGHAAAPIHMRFLDTW